MTVRVVRGPDVKGLPGFLLFVSLELCPETTGSERVCETTDCDVTVIFRYCAPLAGLCSYHHRGCVVTLLLPDSGGEPT